MRELRRMRLVNDAADDKIVALGLGGGQGELHALAQPRGGIALLLCNARHDLYAAGLHRRNNRKRQIGGSQKVIEPDRLLGA